MVELGEQPKNEAEWKEVFETVRINMPEVIKLLNGESSQLSRSDSAITEEGALIMHYAQLCSDKIDWSAFRKAHKPEKKRKLIR